MRQVRNELPELFGRFCKLAKAEGWEFSRNYLGVKEWKVNWIVQSAEDFVTI